MRRTSACMGMFVTVLAAANLAATSELRAAPTITAARAAYTAQGVQLTVRFCDPAVRRPTTFRIGWQVRRTNGRLVASTTTRLRSARRCVGRYQNLAPVLGYGHYGVITVTNLRSRRLDTARTGEPVDHGATASLQSSHAQRAVPRLPICNSPVMGGSVRPRRWDNGCTVNIELQGMRWSKWDGRLAVGRGVHEYNACDPSCASGPVQRFPARVWLDGVRTCELGSGRARIYTRLRYTFRVPAGNRVGLTPGTKKRVIPVPCF
jgi:hypothetical protein